MRTFFAFVYILFTKYASTDIIVMGNIAMLLLMGAIYLIKIKRSILCFQFVKRFYKLCSIYRILRSNQRYYVCCYQKQMLVIISTTLFRCQIQVIYRKPISYFHASFKRNYNAAHIYQIMWKSYEKSTATSTRRKRNISSISTT